MATCRVLERPVIPIAAKPAAAWGASTPAGLQKNSPGFGESPAPSGSLSLTYLAAVAAAYAGLLGWNDRVDVIGQSHGAAVAQTLAARHSSLVGSVV